MWAGIPSTAAGSRRFRQRETTGSNSGTWMTTADCPWVDTSQSSSTVAEGRFPHLDQETVLTLGLRWAGLRDSAEAKLIAD
jgi:hypothetical protein